MTENIIAFLGGGNMATSLIGGLIADGCPPDTIWVTDADAAKLGDLQERFHVRTTADNSLADAERAIELIQPIVLFYGNWQHLDTLAAAHARAGNLELATRMQKQALLEAKNFASDDLVAELEARLDLYLAGQTYTE